MRSLLLHNPNAGAGGHTEKELLAALKVGGHESAYCSTKGDGFPEALSGKFKQALVAGGDGTIAKVLTQLPDRSRPVGIIPLGSANNVARSLGIAGTPQELAERFDASLLRRLDIGVASGPWGDARFVEAVGLGALPAAMAHKDTNGKTSGSRKILRGRTTLADVLSELDPVRLEIRIDGNEHHGNYIAVEILNTGSTGPALPLAPAADPGDGLLDVLLVPEKDREAFRAWIDAPHDAEPGFGTTMRARMVEFVWDGSPLRIDDELADAPKGTSRVSVAIEPVPVQIMTLSNGTKAKRRERDIEAAD